MATHSSILAWEIPWTEESGGHQSTGSWSVGHNLATKQQQHPAWILFTFWYWNLWKHYNISAGYSLSPLLGTRKEGGSHWRWD